MTLLELAEPSLEIPDTSEDPNPAQTLSFPSLAGWRVKDPPKLPFQPCTTFLIGQGR